MPGGEVGDGRVFMAKVIVCGQCGKQKAHHAKGLCRNCYCCMRRHLNPALVEKARIRSEKWRKDNPEKAAAAIRRWQDANPERIREKHVAWVKANPQKVADADRKWRNANADKIRMRDQILMEEAIRQLGDKCACPGCGVSERLFLTIDHINGLDEGGRRDHAIREAKKSGWDKTKFQMLCWNCNMTKSNKGFCPVH